jgi:hypothetical protein
MPAHPAAPTSSAETPRLVIALPRRRAAATVSSPQKPLTATAMMLTHGPHAASLVSCPCRTDWPVEGTDTVSGTLSVAGTFTL